MSLTLGEKLRQAREARGISISEVAEQTRISALYLESIENDDYRGLPGGIFNKGFVKNFAKYVGVDEQEALQDYTRLISSQGEPVAEESKTYRPEVLTDDQSRSSLIPTLIFAAIILGLLTWGVLALLNYYQESQIQPAVANTNTSANTNAAGNTNVSANANSVNANVNTVANTNTQPMPSTNEIKVEFKATSEKVALEATVDGKKMSKEVLPSTPETYTAQQSLKLRYYRGFANLVQITLNGKQITPPSANPKMNGIEFTITKDNIAQILQSGQISTEVPNANTTTNANVMANTTTGNAATR